MTGFEIRYWTLGSGIEFRETDPKSEKYHAQSDAINNRKKHLPRTKGLTRKIRKAKKKRPNNGPTVKHSIDCSNDKYISKKEERQ
ncbi:hypothetical protein [Fusobacterium vincentii ATCC 49256]|uniref:Uncharacterized protein n=1 Tax=Fusobacterium vincentii ATCC 49256 TaxID=209882 RepID=Q7P3Y7_FUSVC|nr:hypothetical protein [Fusobacterium vincentii ATCC 49256]